MALKLMEGDYVPDRAGAFVSLTGKEELLNRVLFKLTARRGSFPLLPEVGSRLYLLLREKPANRQAMGAAYVTEALSDEEGLSVTETVWDEGSHTLRVFLQWQGESLSADISV